MLVASRSSVVDTCSIFLELHQQCLLLQIIDSRHVITSGDECRCMVIFVIYVKDLGLKASCLHHYLSPFIYIFAAGVHPANSSSPLPADLNKEEKQQEGVETIYLSFSSLSFFSLKHNRRYLDLSFQYTIDRIHLFWLDQHFHIEF